MEIEKLRETYLKYKNGSYNLRKYSSEQDLSKVYSKGKIFVMKGGFTKTDYFIIILCWILAIYMLCILRQMQ